MTEIPVTVTATDRMKELKELAEKITSLKFVKEIAEREVKLKIYSADQATERLKKVESDMTELLKTFDTASKETEQFIQFCDKLIRESMEPMKQLVEFHVKLLEKCDEADRHLKRAEKAGMEIHDQVVKDMESMSTQARDLSIYRVRLENYYREHLPDQKILL